MSHLVLSQQITHNRHDFVKLVRKWGDVNTDAILDDSCQIFSVPEIEGFIGYKVASMNAVVFGDPVCSQEDKPALAKAFEEDCRRRHLGMVYTIVSKEFAEWACENLSAIGVEFGKKFIFEPHNNPVNNKGSKAVLVRKKVKHALKAGVIVKEYGGDDPNIEKQIEEVAAKWLQKRQGPQIFLSRVTLFKDKYGKRWFYALKDGNVIGILLLNELQSQQGWLLNNVMMTGDAPNGLSELLIIHTLEVLSKEGCQLALAGPVPLTQLGKIIGVGEIKSNLMRLIFNVARYIFNLDGHGVYWEKFQLQSQSSFLIFPHKNLRFSSIKALLQAMNASKK